MNYIKKLKEIEEKIFTITEIFPGMWQKWDATSKQMIKQEKVTEEEKKAVNALGFPEWKYVINTKVRINGEEFGCPFSFSQLKEMKTKANVYNDIDLIGVSFEANNNGQAGKEIRYYFKLVKTEPAKTESTDVNIDDIKFDE